MRDTVDVRLVGLSAGPHGSTRFVFEAPPFGEAASELYRHRSLFDQLPDERDDVFGLLSDMLADVSNLVRDSEKFDVSVLERLEGFRWPIFANGVAEIRLAGGGQIDRPVVVVGPSLPDAAASLHGQTPGPIRVRVIGRLDTLRGSDNVFSLVLDGGQRLRGVLWVMPPHRSASFSGRRSS